MFERKGGIYLRGWTGPPAALWPPPPSKAAEAFGVLVRVGVQGSVRLCELSVHAAFRESWSWVRCLPGCGKSRLGRWLKPQVVRWLPWRAWPCRSRLGLPNLDVKSSPSVLSKETYILRPSERKLHFTAWEALK